MNYCLLVSNPLNWFLIESQMKCTRIFSIEFAQYYEIGECCVHNLKVEILFSMHNFVKKNDLVFWDLFELLTGTVYPSIALNINVFLGERHKSW